MNMVSLADSLGAWSITAESLARDLAKENSPGTNIVVMDGNHVYLTFRTADRNLVADFDSPDLFAEDYPEATQVVAIAKLVKAVSAAIETR